MRVKLMDIELKSCKKCGYPHGRCINYGHAFSNKITYRISCPQCSYCTKEKDTLQEAVDAWNYRNRKENLNEKDSYFIHSNL